MGKIITQCPSCNGTELQVTKIDCTNCHTKFEGQFEISPLLKLADEDLKFILDFVKCSGSLKEMAEKHKISYPTLRNRLNVLIDTLEQFTVSHESSKEEVLTLLEQGKITAKEAAIMLKKL